MRRALGWLSVVGFFAGGMSGAAAATLDDVIAAFLKPHPVLEREDEKVRLAEAQLQQAEGAFDWHAAAESGWERLYVPEVRGGFLTSDLLKADAWRTTLGLSKRFRSGVEIRPGITFYANADVTSAQTFGATEAVPALNLSVPLWRGFGSNNTEAANERAGSLALQGSRLQRDFAGQRAVHDAVQVYWRCLAARQRLEILSAARRDDEDYLASLRHQAQSGELEAVFLDRVVANQSLDAVALGRAQSEERDCRGALGLAMAQPGPVAVEGEFPPMEGAVDAANKLTPSALVEKALARRADLKALAQHTAAAREQAQGAEDATEPKVDLLLDTTKVLVRLSKSLSGGAEKGTAAASASAERQARLNQRHLESQIRQEIAAGLQGLHDAAANWAALNNSAVLMEKVNEDARRRERAGFISRQEFHAVRAETAKVRQALIDARLQFAANVAGLHLATGALGPDGDAEQGSALAALFRTVPKP